MVKTLIYDDGTKSNTTYILAPTTESTNKIDGVRVELDLSGFINIHGNTVLQYTKGVCEASIINTSKASIQINEATLAWQMTACRYLLNPCIANHSYGEVILDSVTLWLRPDRKWKPPNTKRNITKSTT